MPSRPKRPCRQSSCPNLVDSGYCDTHKVSAKQYDRWRGSPASRGYDHDWQRVREQALKRDNYLCILCLATNRATPARDVDHIVPIAIDPTRRLDLSNLQSLCRSCHNAKTAKEHSFHP